MLSNILNIALSVIPKQAFEYYEYDTKANTDIGIDEVGYKAPITLYGSIQPVTQAVYIEMGLDFTKRYYNAFCSRFINDVKRDVSSDKVMYNGQTMQVIGKTEWSAYNGWDSFLMVAINE